MSEEKEIKNVYNKILEYEKKEHLKNQKRIRIGLKVNILFPLIFLFMSFIITSAKLVFLILWIITLFGIAAYLIYVEYSDYKLMKQLVEFGLIEGDNAEGRSLIGGGIQQAENIINEKLDYADDILEEEKQRILNEIEEKKQQLKELALQRKEKQEDEDNEEHH